MKKIIVIFIVFFAILQNLAAADLNFVKDAESNILDTIDSNTNNAVFILNYKEDTDNLYDENSVITTGDLMLIRNKAYTKKQMLDGTFDAERNNEGIYSYRAVGDNNLVLVYSNPLEIGDHSVNGTATVTFKKLVIDKNGVKYDLHMLIDNVKIKTLEATTKPILLLLFGNRISPDYIWAGSYSALQEKEASVYIQRYNSFLRLNDDDYVTAMSLDGAPSVGVSYDLKFYVTKANSNELINKEMFLSFADIDQPDVTNSRAYFLDENTPSPYAESITLKEGIIGDVHLAVDSSLYISDTPFGRNTKFSGTRNLNPGLIAGSLLAKVKSLGFKINWSGSNCWTGIVMLNSLKVETKAIGKYSDKVEFLTPSDSAIISGRNKVIEIIPEENYYIKRVIIDGEEIDLDDLVYDSSRGSYTYTFENITEDHVFECELSIQKYIIHYDGNGGTGEMEDTKVLIGEDTKLSKNEFKKDNNTFEGWKLYANENGQLVPLKKDGKDIILEDEADFSNIYEDYTEFTLLAQWIYNPGTGSGPEMFILLLSAIALASVLIIYKRRYIIKN